MLLDIAGPILRDVQRNNIEQQYSQSPLRIVNDAGFVRPITALQSSFGTLKYAFNAFEMLCVEAFDDETAICEADNFGLRRTKYWTILSTEQNAGSDEMPLTVEDRVERAVHLAAKIHLRAVALRKQHDDCINEKDMKRLVDVLREIDAKFWTAAHYVHVWM